MASIDKRVRDGRVTWQARWRDPAGVQRKRTFTRKLDAERYLTNVEHSQLVDTYVDPGRSRLTVGEWSRIWLRQLQVKPSTQARYESLLRVHIAPTWATVPLNMVTHSGASAWVAGLSDVGLAPASVRQAHRVLSLLLSSAVKDNRIARNPADGVGLPRSHQPHKRYLTHEQVATLADAAGEHGLLIRVLVYTGLRFGELAALRIRHLDLMRRRLFIAESVTEVKGKAVFGTTKSHATRSVALPRSLVGELAELTLGRSLDDFVFTAPQGGVLLLRNFRRQVFDPAVETAGLSGLTPHELRHTAASLAISAGANVKAVQRMLGHKSAAMTLDVYADLFDDDLDAVADRLDAASQKPGVPLVRPEATVTNITQRDVGR
jgi:integrase